MLASYLLAVYTCFIFQQQHSTFPLVAPPWSQHEDMVTGRNMAQYEPIGISLIITTQLSGIVKWLPEINLGMLEGNLR